MLLNLFLLNVFIMLCCWVVTLLNKRAGIVDVAWSFCIALNVLLSAVFIETAPDSVRIFIGLFSGFWFLRLGWHLLRRYQSEQQEDRRYANMRRTLGNFQNLGFLAFFIFQAGLAILFFLPMWMLLNRSANQWGSESGILLFIAALIMLVAFMGEALADQQLYQFKLDAKNRGKTLDQGLWKYSRHPNYFFEWLHWFAYPILGLATGLYVLWIYPVLMWLFLYYVTGIPFNEQQALKNRGQNYRDYQQRTSLFILWKPKK